MAGPLTAKSLLTLAFAHVRLTPSAEIDRYMSEDQARQVLDSLLVDESHRSDLAVLLENGQSAGTIFECSIEWFNTVSHRFAEKLGFSPRFLRLDLKSSKITAGART
jgi:hypothetical protein